MNPHCFVVDLCCRGKGVALFYFKCVNNSMLIITVKRYALVQVVLIAWCTLYFSTSQMNI